jgi:hypothetical protein
MSLYKQEGSDKWYVSIAVPGKARIRRSTGTSDETQAQEYHDRLKAEMWREEKFGETPDRVWDDAVRRFLVEKADKRSLEHDKRMLKWATPFLQGSLLYISGNCFLHTSA